MFKMLGVLLLVISIQASAADIFVVTNNSRVGALMMNDQILLKELDAKKHIFHIMSNSFSSRQREAYAIELKPMAVEYTIYVSGLEEGMDDIWLSSQVMKDKTIVKPVVDSYIRAVNWMNQPGTAKRAMEEANFIGTGIIEGVGNMSGIEGAAFDDRSGLVKERLNDKKAGLNEFKYKR